MVQSQSTCMGTSVLKLRKKKPSRFLSEDLSISNGWCRGGTACSGFFSSRLRSEAPAAMSGKGGVGKRRRKKKRPSLREEPGALLSPSLSSALHSLPPALHHLFLPSGLWMWASVGEQLGMWFCLLLEVFSKFSFWSFLFFRRCMFFNWERRGKMQPKQYFQQSFYSDVLKTCPSSYLYFICGRLKKNFIWNRYFHGNIHLWWDVIPQMFQLRNFVSSGRKKNWGAEQTKTKLTGKHAVLQVNGLKCQLVNCHKAREVNQSTRVNGAVLIYTEDLALDFNRTSLASCFSAYPSSSLFNKLSVILGLSFNNSPFSLHSPFFLLWR